VALEGTDGPEPVVPDADDPDPEPPDPDPADPVPDDPDPPEPVPDDPVAPGPEPSAVEPDDPEVDDPAPLEAAAVFAIPAEQAERQNRERLKRPKRNCERREFNDSPNPTCQRSRRLLVAGHWLASNSIYLHAHHGCRRICNALFVSSGKHDNFGYGRLSP
jgi:hypothetical protein